MAGARGPRAADGVLESEAERRVEMPLLREAMGAVLRRARLSQGRTLRDVASTADISVPYLSEVELGRKELSSEVLPAICRALTLPLDDLLDQVGAEVRRREEPDAGPATRRHRRPGVNGPAGRADRSAPAGPGPAGALSARHLDPRRPARVASCEADSAVSRSSASRMVRESAPGCGSIILDRPSVTRRTRRRA